MIIYEIFRLLARKFYLKYTYRCRRQMINNDEFTIISNNCWGGIVYQSYGIRYNTPTVGLFIMADDYIKLLTNLQKYIDCKLRFIDPNTSKWYQILKDTSQYGRYPIGILEDIEIHFLHYKDKNEAIEKWNNRCKRINWNRLLVKFNDQNGCTSEHIEKFKELNYINKICFISKKNKQIQDTLKYDFLVRIRCCNNNILASYEPLGKSKYININKLINNL